MKRKKIITKIVGGLLAIIVIYILISRLIKNWQQISEFDFSINGGLFLLAILLQLSSVPLGAFMWRKLLNLISGGNLNLSSAVKIHINSWLSRYIPGKVNSVLAKIYLTNREGIDKKSVTVSIIYENLFIILSSFIVSIPALAFFLSNYLLNAFYYIGLAVVLIACVLFIFSPILNKTLNICLRYFKKEEIPTSSFLGSKDVLVFLIYYCLNRILIGFSFFVTIVSITDLNIKYAVTTVGIFSIASLMGILINLAPSGLGVREGALVIFLRPIFSIELSILISLLSRVVTVIADIPLLFIIPFIRKYEKNRLLGGLFWGK